MLDVTFCQCPNKMCNTNVIRSNIAIWEKPATISPNIITFSERRYQGIATYERGDFKEVLEAISKGLIKPENMITKKVSWFSHMLDRV